MASDDRRAAVHTVAVWFHSFDFGDGVIAAGYKSAETLQREAKYLPEVRGKTVLDINTADGWFAFECERRGAARVVAMDEFLWSMDFGEWVTIWRECAKRNELPRHPRDTACWRPHLLPGRAGFDTAHRLLRSNVEHVVADLATMPESEVPRLGQFDVVLYLGSLYHMKNPLGALERVRHVTAPGGLAVIETQAMAIPGHEQTPLCEVFGPTNTLNYDPTNHWAPNCAAIRELCLAAGFSRVEVLAGPPTNAERLGLRAAVHSLLPGPLKPVIRVPATPRPIPFRAWINARV